MKTIWTVVLAAGLFAASCGVAFAADDKTVTGEAKCVKCSLKEADACQTAVVTDEGGKKVTYYLTHNDVSKDFQSQNSICKKPAKVKATGVTRETGGKKELTPTKIELAKD